MRLDADLLSALSAAAAGGSVNALSQKSGTRRRIGVGDNPFSKSRLDEKKVKDLYRNRMAVLVGGNQTPHSNLLLAADVAPELLGVASASAVSHVGKVKDADSYSPEEIARIKRLRSIGAGAGSTIGSILGNLSPGEFHEMNYGQTIGSSLGAGMGSAIGEHIGHKKIKSERQRLDKDLQRELKKASKSIQKNRANRFSKKEGR